MQVPSHLHPRAETETRVCGCYEGEEARAVPERGDCGWVDWSDAVRLAKHVRLLSTQKKQKKNAGTDDERGTTKKTKNCHSSTKW